MFKTTLLAPIAAILFSTAASALPVTFTYTSQPLKLPEVDGGYFINGQPYTDTAPKVFSFGFTVELDALGGRLANTTIREGYRNGQFATTASRNGKEFLSSEDFCCWFSNDFPQETLSYGLSISFGADGNISSWGFGTDGESYAYTFGNSMGDLFYYAMMADWRPEVPAYRSDGPGTWTHTALPTVVPLPAAGWLLGATALALAGATRGRRRSH